MKKKKANELKTNSCTALVRKTEKENSYNLIFIEKNAKIQTKSKIETYTSKRARH